MYERQTGGQRNTDAKNKMWRKRWSINDPALLEIATGEGTGWKLAGPVAF